MHKLPIYIINLKRDVQKREHMIKEMSKFDLDYELIEAIDGSLLSESEISEVYDKEKSISSIGRELSRGEIGCALSHRNIYKKMIDDSIKEAVILEDDVELPQDLIAILNKNKKFPKDCELMLFGYWQNQVIDVKFFISFYFFKYFWKNYKIVRFASNMYGTYGYFITQNGAKKLLEILDQKIYMPIDHYSDDDMYVNLYGIYPQVVNLSKKFDLITDLENERNELRKNMVKKESFVYIKFILNNIGLLNIIRHFLVVMQKVKIFIKRLKPLRRYQ
jgi:glycosyl transferase family 25